MSESRNQKIAQIDALLMTEEYSGFTKQQSNAQRKVQEFLKKLKLTPQPTAHESELYYGALVVKLFFDVLLNQFAEQVKGFAIEAPVKLPIRVQEKREDYTGEVSRIMDFVRGTVAFKTLDEVYESLEGLLDFLVTYGLVVRTIHTEAEIEAESARVVRYKDRILKPLGTHFRDLLLVLEIPVLNWEKVRRENFIFSYQEDGKLMLDVSNIDFKALGWAEEVVEKISLDLASIEVEYYGLNEEHLKQVGLMPNTRGKLSFDKQCGYKVELRLSPKQMFDIGSKHHDDYKQYRTLYQKYCKDRSTMSDKELDKLIDVIIKLQKLHDQIWEEIRS